MGTKITGVGSYLPERIVTREELAVGPAGRYEQMPEELYDVPRQRRHASAAEPGALMGAKACLSAVEHAGLAPKDIDLVICASAMPDLIYPKDGPKLAMLAGLVNATAMDLDVACASFITLLKVGTALIEQGMHRRIALVCISNWTGRAFDPTQDFSPIGDAAGAVVLEASERASLIGVHEIRDERFFHFVKLESPFVTKREEYLRFAISDEFREFSKVGSLSIIRDLMAKADWSAERTDWFVPHQVGVKATRGWTRSLGMPEAKLLQTFDWTGNCMMANMPTILDHYVRKEARIARGDVLLLFALASGFHGSAMLWRF